MRAVPRDKRNIVRPVVDLSQCVAIPGITGVAEFCQGQPVLLFDEGEGAFAFDLFQPEIWIVIGRCDRRPDIDGHGLNSMGGVCAA